MLALLLSSFLTFVQLNCENLFDCRHDEGKEDFEFLSDGARHWSPTHYWKKLNMIGQEILSCSSSPPDLVALCEVENDSVLHDLTRRSLLRNAGYHYLMTQSPDVRGLDVALLYQPHTFRPLCYDIITVPPLTGMRPTRDILYVQGETITGDTLHIFVVHAPSRYAGELETRANRNHVATILLQAVATVGSGMVLVTGDFNDYADSPSLLMLTGSGLRHLTATAVGRHGAVHGTYNFHGRWQSLDHILATPTLADHADTAFVNDAPFLLVVDDTYGGWKPRRTFNGYRYLGGFSDHLPLVVRFRF